MQQILKRLELIKTGITIEDEEIIEMQMLKIASLNADNDVKDILKLLKENNFTRALAYIDAYLTRYSGLALYQDQELSGLKMELKVLEAELQALSEERVEYLNEIDEFNTRYSLHLGETIRKILELKEKILKRVIEKKQQRFENLKREYDEIKSVVEDLEERLAQLDEFDDAYDELYEELQKQKEKLNEKRKETKQAKVELEEDEAFEAYEEVKEDYEEFNKEYKEVLSQERFELDEEEKKELKKLFRKASRLCHPDIVADELKEQAHEIMAELNEAYKQQDIDKVKKILHALENGTGFEVASDKINDKELLKTKIGSIREDIEALKAELTEIKEDETYKTLQEIDDLESYLDEMKDALAQEMDRLQDEYEEALMDEANEAFATASMSEADNWDIFLDEDLREPKKEEKHKKSSQESSKDDYWSELF